MKSMTKAVLAMLALGASTWVIIAQQENGPGAGGPGAISQSVPSRHGPFPPFFRALDANHDGVIDAGEIANAPAALKTLLKSGSTTLTLEDLMGTAPMLAHAPTGLRIINSGSGGSDGAGAPGDTASIRAGGINGSGGPGSPSGTPPANQ